MDACIPQGPGSLARCISGASAAFNRPVAARGQSAKWELHSNLVVIRLLIGAVAWLVKYFFSGIGLFKFLILFHFYFVKYGHVCVNVLVLFYEYKILMDFVSQIHNTFLWPDCLLWLSSAFLTGQWKICID